MKAFVIATAAASLISTVLTTLITLIGEEPRLRGFAQYRLPYDFVLAIILGSIGAAIKRPIPRLAVILTAVVSISLFILIRWAPDSLKDTGWTPRGIWSTIIDNYAVGIFAFALAYYLRGALDRSEPEPGKA